MYHTLEGFSAWPCAAATAPGNPATIPLGAMTNFDPTILHLQDEVVPKKISTNLAIEKRLQQPPF
jgi:hypothetical protein